MIKLFNGATILISAMLAPIFTIIFLTAHQYSFHGDDVLRTIALTIAVYIASFIGVASVVTLIFLIGKDCK